MKKKTPVWNLGLFYKSPEDPMIEKDMKAMEKACESFAERFDTAHKNDKKYLTDEAELLIALTEYEKLISYLDCKPFFYFNFLRDTDGKNPKASSAISLLLNRLAKAQNKLTFFEISIGSIPADQQKKILENPSLAHFKIFLKRIFDDAKFNLSVPEEKILNLKSQTSYEMWIDSTERILSSLTVKWKGRTLPLPEADHLIHETTNPKQRYALNALVLEQLKAASSSAEAEINAVYTDKKINDELRGYVTPYENTVRGYRNDPLVVKKLVETVSAAFPLAHRFYKIKAKLLKLKKLAYADRKMIIGQVKTQFSFADSLQILKKTFGDIDPKYSKILDSYIQKGQIDAAPRVGKKGGAYCWGAYSTPTFVLLNHTDTLDSLSTFAHEMGHAFHTEFSKAQGPLYSNYSTALAETASTLFEAIAFDAVFDSLSDKEKIIVLHDRINDDVSTVFRQIACFNYELELHNAVRSKGFLPKEEIANIHNKNMKAYLGPLFDLKTDDGLFFVQWSHIRRFFYVYSYAYGQLVSKAMLRRYRKDKTFWKSIEKFLAAGCNGSSEEILLSIGIDVSSPEFFKEGLKEIEDDIAKLEKLVGKK